jgi:hypothetical protein
MPVVLDTHGQTSEKTTRDACYLRELAIGTFTQRSSEKYNRAEHPRGKEGELAAAARGDKEL